MKVPLWIAIAAIACFAFLLASMVEHVRARRRLHKLGVVPNKVTSWYFGLDQIRIHLRAVVSGTLLDVLRQRFDQYGHTYQVDILGNPLIITDDPENIKALLATQFRDFGKGPEFHALSKDFLGDSIFSTDGNPWHRARHILRPQFSKERLSDLEVFEKHTQRFMSHISEAPIDVLNFFFRLTMDVTTEFLLGESVNSLDFPNDQEFANAFNVAQEQISMRARLGTAWRLLPRSKEYKKAIKVINDFLEPYIQRVQHVDSGELEKKTEKQYTFLEALAIENKERTFLRDQMLAVLLAGRDTTSLTLTWSLYHLARNPETYAKLRQEVLDRLGSQRCPDASDLQDMKYLHNVINETLRLCPVLPLNLREALCDTTLPNGGGEGGREKICVPKGAGICYSPYLLQRRMDIFGPTVEDFIPDRWFHWAPKPWTYIPFNGGPRLCAGQMYALYELRYILARLAQRYERIESLDRKPHLIGTGLLLQPRDPVVIRFTKAKGKADEFK